MFFFKNGYPPPPPPRYSTKQQIKKLIKGIIPKKLLYNKHVRLFRLQNNAKSRLAPRKLLRFDIHVTDHCNLRCKGCLHFSPLAEEVFIDTAILERDCSRLAELTGGRIADICVLGGEPLLHPHITGVLDIARKYFPVDRIYIVTNGILLSMQPETFWKNCIKNNIEIEISLYPVKIDLNRIKELTALYGIKLGLRGDPKIQTRTWMFQPLDLSGKQDTVKSHTVCELANLCFQLVDGRLYQCETTAFIGYFNKYFNQHLQITEKDYVDIYKAKNLAEILDFLCRPMPFCRYCRTKDVDFVEWDKSGKEIAEWV
jgi:sulfatase maturation enzyme AslB (radical SAM superfamily)